MFISKGKHPRDCRTYTREQNPDPSADDRDSRTVTFVITAHLVGFVSALAVSMELLAAFIGVYLRSALVIYLKMA